MSEERTALDTLNEICPMEEWSVLPHHAEAYQYLRSIPADAAEQLDKLSGPKDSWHAVFGHLSKDPQEASNSINEQLKAKDAEIAELTQFHEQRAETIRVERMRIKELEGDVEQRARTLHFRNSQVMQLQSRIKAYETRGKELTEEVKVAAEPAVIKAAPDGLEEARDIIQRFYVSAFGHTIKDWETYATAALEAVERMREGRS